MFFSSYPKLSDYSDSKPYLQTLHKEIDNTDRNTFQSILDDCKAHKNAINMKGVVIDRVPYIITIMGEFVPLREMARYQ
ncbi:hypothetical protein JCM16418A_14770 [Paenibacillus pini]